MRAASWSQVGVIALGLAIFTAPAWAKDASRAAATAAAISTLQEELSHQQQRIQELERLLREQKQLLEVLREQMAAREAVPPLTHSASATAPAVQAIVPKQEVQRIATELDAAAENQRALNDKANQVDNQIADSEKSLTGKLRGLGNFTFGGDLRLRYEPFRGGGSASRNRGRFRARFDVKNKFTDEWSAGLRISTGDDTDPISTNQTMTNFFQRKSFRIDQAYVTYTPSWAKPLNVTGGKFGYTWKRTELTLDNDLNPEGISPSLSFDLKDLPLTNVKLVGFALPFNESGGGPDSYMLGGALETTWKLGSRATLGASASYGDWFRTDAIAKAQLADKMLSGSTNSNAASPTAYASRFGLLDTLAQLNIDTGAKRWPLLLLFDFVTNTRACSNVEIAGVACNPRDRQGYWAELAVGQTKNPHDVQIGYTLIHIEREAVLSAFNFSDLRAPTDVLNHRFLFAYQAYKNIQLGYTLLVGRLLTPGGPWLKRSQIDLIYKF